MKILWVAAKAPWPAVDGGRLVMSLTIEALHAAGHQVTLVAPANASRDDADASNASRPCRCVFVPAQPHSLAWSALRTLVGHRPISVARHTLTPVREAVSRLLGAEAFDVVHAEQPQTLPQCEAASAARIPTVLRAQNVESDLMAATADAVPIASALLRREARRLARWEGMAVRRTAATVALTERDSRRLAQLSGAPEKIRCVPAPFPHWLPPGDERLPGDPALVLLASAGWRPNEQSTAWFLDTVWPRVRAALPRAQVHVFGATGAHRFQDAGLVLHGSPSDSRVAFPPGGILVLPLRFGSGIRMRILEAWARGSPVVASPAAIAGLNATDGREVLVAHDAGGFVSGIAALHDDPGIAEALTKRGREVLETHHSSAAIAAQLGDVYRLAVAGARGEAGTVSSHAGRARQVDSASVS